MKIANISLYQIYLHKFHENIFKYQRLNLFKEIFIPSNSASRGLSNLLQSFPIVFLYTLVNVINFIFSFTGSFVGLLFNPSPGHIIQGGRNLGCWAPKFREGIVVAGIFYSQYWILLLVWLDTESCFQMESLPAATHSIQTSTASSMNGSLLIVRR